VSKSIVDKLSLRKFKQVAVLGLPDGADYLAELTAFDTELGDRKYDLIFAFTLDMEALRKLVNDVIERGILTPNGYVFAAYPKKGNRVFPTFIHRDELISGLGSDEDGYIGTSDLKFARMVGLDDVFTVVGFKMDASRNKPAAAKVSQRVDDYIAFIPSIEQDLHDTPELLAFYQSLTPGYRKDWARFVYGVKQEATQAKRREEMKTILGQGYKSFELYRKDRT